MCPDTDSFTLDFNNQQLVAYVTTCIDALDKLGNSEDRITECETDDDVIEAYVNKKVDFTAIWLSEYFNL